MISFTLTRGEVIEGVSRVVPGCSKFHITSPHFLNNLSLNHCVSLSLSFCLLSLCLSLHICLSDSFSSPFILSVSLSAFPSTSPSPTPSRYALTLLTSEIQFTPSLVPSQLKPPSSLICPNQQPHNLSSHLHSHLLPTILHLSDKANILKCNSNHGTAVLKTGDKNKTSYHSLCDPSHSPIVSNSMYPLLTVPNPSQFSGSSKSPFPSHHRTSALNFYLPQMLPSTQAHISSPN